jgi:hypothetical protein
LIRAEAGAGQFDIEIVPSGSGFPGPDVFLGVKGVAEHQDPKRILMARGQILRKFHRSWKSPAHILVLAKGG